MENVGTCVTVSVSLAHGQNGRRPVPMWRASFMEKILMMVCRKACSEAPEDEELGGRCHGNRCLLWKRAAVR